MNEKPTLMTGASASADFITMTDTEVTLDHSLSFYVGDSTSLQSRLLIAYGVTIHFSKPMPCWWWRFWQWLLLGWRWDKEVT